MNKISYSGYRFSPDIIQQAIWLYLRFTLSSMSDKPISPLRQRMIDDMTARRFSEDTQRDYVRNATSSCTKKL